MSKTNASDVLSWEEGLDRVLAEAVPQTPNAVAVSLSAGHLCAGPVISPVAVPPFANSSMDGFAVIASDTTGATETQPVVLTVAGTAPAGAPFQGIVRKGHAVEIMTGAPIPEGSDAVVRVEVTRQAADGRVAILQEVKPGTSVRAAGADLASGTIVVGQGERLTPGLVGLLASCGMASVDVYPKPRIALAVGGDEVVPVETGRALGPGEIYDSNSPMLIALIQSWGFEVTFLGRMPDNSEAMKHMMRGALEHDVLVTVGGVSMGRHDYVRQCLAELGGREIFWRLKQQPGGPLLFGRIERTLLFGLPGNPVSSYVCADLYLQSALRKMAGEKQAKPLRLHAVLTASVSRRPGKAAFLRAQLSLRNRLWYVAPEPKQDSNIISSIARHHGYLLVPETVETLDAGAMAEVVITQPALLAMQLLQAETGDAARTD